MSAIHESENDDASEDSRTCAHEGGYFSGSDSEDNEIEDTRYQALVAGQQANKAEEEEEDDDAGELDASESGEEALSPIINPRLDGNEEDDDDEIVKREGDDSLVLTDQLGTSVVEEVIEENPKATMEQIQTSVISSTKNDHLLDNNNKIVSKRPYYETQQDHQSSLVSNVSSSSSPPTKDQPRLSNLSSMVDTSATSNNNNNRDGGHHRRSSSSMGDWQNAQKYVRLREVDLPRPNLRKYAVYYDEIHEAMVMNRRSEFQVFTVNNERQKTSDEDNSSHQQDVNDRPPMLTFHFPRKALDVKLSPCLTYVVVLAESLKDKGLNEVIIMSPKTGEQTTLRPRTQHAMILHGGATWLCPPVPLPLTSEKRLPVWAANNNNNNSHESDKSAIWKKRPILCLVTSHGLETHEVFRTGNGIETSLKSSESLKIDFFWSFARKNVLCCQTPAGDVVPFFFPNMEPYPRKGISIKSERKSQSQGESAMACCYDEVYFLLIRSQLINVYRLTPARSEFVKALRTAAGPIHAISCVDSLLLVHNKYARVTMVYDIKGEGDQPAMRPLPLDTSLAGPSLLPYADCWGFFPPNWLLDAMLDRIWKLELDLLSAARAFATDDAIQLVQFLMRRSLDEEKAKQAISNLAVDVLIASSAGGSSDYLTPEATLWIRVLAEHAAAPLTDETARIVFTPDNFIGSIIDKCTETTTASLRASACLEYMGGLVTHGVRLSPDSNNTKVNIKLLFARIATLLSESNRMDELYQLCLMQTGPDCDEAIALLKENRTSSPERVQVAIDSLHRMGRSLEELEELLFQDSFGRAVKLAIARKMLSADSVVIQLLRACKGRLDRCCLLYDALKANNANCEWLQGKLKTVPDVRIPQELKSAFGV